MLLLLCVIPLMAGLLVLLLHERHSFWTAFGGSLASLLGVCAVTAIWSTGGGTWLEANVVWLDAAGIRLHLAADGLSLLLLLLTAIVYPVIVLASHSGQLLKRLRPYYALLMLAQAALFGVFTARDAFFFYFFYELALIPVYFICAFWGGEGSLRITLKFFIYTLAGSLFLLIGIIYLYMQTPQPHSFDLDAFYALDLTVSEQRWLLLAFFVGFAVKIPLFPLHTWQPDTYKVAPVGGTMLLAGIMLKMGLYGLFRFVIPLLGDALAQWGEWLLLLALVGVLYGSIIALRQQDMKRLVAYSSLAHVGLMAAGLLTGNYSGMQGAAVQMLSHGINIVALFWVVDILERRFGTQHLDGLGGVAADMKGFAWMTAVVMLANVGLPLTNGFVGELLLLNGLYQYAPGWALAGGLSVVLAAAYMLRFYRWAFLGPVAASRSQAVHDVVGWERGGLIVLVLLIVAIGVYPSPWLHLAQDTLGQMNHLIGVQQTAVIP